MVKNSLAVILITFFLSACNSDDVAINIHDNGSTLHLKVKVRDPAKSVDYDKTFNVEGMGDRQKKELTNHILDSLGVKK